MRNSIDKEVFKDENITEFARFFSKSLIQISQAVQQIGKSQLDLYEIHQQHHANMRLIVQSLQEIKSSIKELNETMEIIIKPKNSNAPKSDENNSCAFDEDMERKSIEDNEEPHSKRGHYLRDQFEHSESEYKCLQTTTLSDFAGEITIEEYNAFTEEKNDLNMKIKSAQSDLTELRTILHKLDDEKFFRLSVDSVILLFWASSQELLEYRTRHPKEALVFAINALDRFPSIITNPFVRDCLKLCSSVLPQIISHHEIDPKIKFLLMKLEREIQGDVFAKSL